MRKMLFGLSLILVLQQGTLAWADPPEVDGPLPPQVQQGVSDQMQQQLQQRGPLGPAQQGQEAQQVFSSLLRFTHRRDVNYQLEIQQTPDINANALPDGRVVVNSGMLDRLNHDPNAIAFIEAREISHIESGDTDKRAGTQIGTAMLIAPIVWQASLVLKLFALAAHQMLNAGYGSQLEYEADNHGMELMQRAGYDPNGALVVFNVMKADEATRSSISATPADKRYTLAIQWMNDHAVAVHEPQLGSQQAQSMPAPPMTQTGPPVPEYQPPVQPQARYGNPGGQPDNPQQYYNPQQGYQQSQPYPQRTNPYYPQQQQANPYYNQQSNPYYPQQASPYPYQQQANPYYPYQRSTPYYQQQAPNQYYPQQQAGPYYPYQRPNPYYSPQQGPYYAPQPSPYSAPYYAPRPQYYSPYSQPPYYNPSPGGFNTPSDTPNQ